MPDKRERQSLAQEMIRDEHLIGMTHEQVVAALGKSDGGPGWPAYGDPTYLVGPNDLDDMWLCVHVEGGKVVRAEIRAD